MTATKPQAERIAMATQDVRLAIAALGGALFDERLSVPLNEYLAYEVATDELDRIITREVLMTRMALQTRVTFPSTTTRIDGEISTEAVPM